MPQACVLRFVRTHAVRPLAHYFFPSWLPLRSEAFSAATTSSRPQTLLPAPAGFVSRLPMPCKKAAGPPACSPRGIPLSFARAFEGTSDPRRSFNHQAAGPPACPRGIRLSFARALEEGTSRHSFNPRSGAIQSRRTTRSPRKPTSPLATARQVGVKLRDCTTAGPDGSTCDSTSARRKRRQRPRSGSGSICSFERADDFDRGTAGETSLLGRSRGRFHCRPMDRYEETRVWVTVHRVEGATRLPSSTTDGTAPGHSLATPFRSLPFPYDRSIEPAG
ncbi:hypothetical protein VTN77DRAFT_6842 [Rasamsonia byssochlamydoides]|uniref:uncharacterized protein n=1 Tax=Rasamsonia byssochlamydoides TaxID=89139 RepID=UPI003742A2D0